MLKIEYTTQFKRDLKLAKRRGKDIHILQRVMEKLEYEERLEAKFRDHGLTGDWVGHRELHLNPDWLLIYKIIPTERTLIFARTGSHSDLFR